ncbi:MULTISPECIES: aspartyl-phosphate phosphatase Spo0E family protein [Cytobacillus]|nr:MULTISPECIES: aspartyl-phosphate phosphatase Spo0E family protein [Cytobacillus]
MKHPETIKHSQMLDDLILSFQSKCFFQVN